MLRTSPVGLAALDRSLRYVRVSDLFAAMNGVSAVDHLGRTPMEVAPDMPEEIYRPLLERALAGEETLGVDIVGEMPGWPGQTRSWEQSFFPLCDHDGEVLGVGVTIVDVTDRSMAEGSIREREATLRLTLESAPSAMLIVTADGCIADLNAEAELLFGYERHELIGEAVDLLVPDRFRDDHPAHRAAFHRDPRTRSMGHGRDDLAGRCKDGREFPAEVGLGVAPGRDDLVTCVVTDLSDRRRAEEEHAVLLAAERAAKDRLARLQHVMDAGLAQLSLDDRMEELLRRVRDAVGAELASVLLLDEEGTGLVATASVGLEEEVEQRIVVPVGLGVAGRAVALRRPVHLADQAFATAKSEVLRRRRLNSIVAAPLVVDDAVIGVLQVAAEPSNHFDESDLGLLPMIADRVALAVDGARAFDRERSIAETLQHSLLPDRLPEVANISVAVRYLPGTAGLHVGGDWYDVVSLADDRVGLVIGDVMGHGVRAAAVMGQLRSAVRIYLEMGTPLPEIAAHLNRLVCDMGDAEITSLLVARLLIDSGELEWVSAGHLPPVVRTGDGLTSFLEGSLSPPLGASAEAEFACATTPMAPGSTILLYTDGLVERRETSIDDGLARLAEVVAVGPAEPAGLCDAVLDLVEEPASDDVAVLAVRLESSTVPPVVLTVEQDPLSERAVRLAVADWLQEVGASAEEAADVLVAVSEALTATAEHGPGGRSRRLVARLVGDQAEVAIFGYGDRFPPEGTNRGRGLVLMEALVDRLVISSNEGEIRLVRRLEQPGG